MKRAICTTLAALSLTTITTVEAVRPIKWNLYNGMNISGTKELGRVWTTLEECQQACAKSVTCGAVVKHNDSDLCIFYELSMQSEPYKSEQATSYIVEVQGTQSESNASIVANLFGGQPSSILDPWAHYAHYDLAESVEIASYDVPLPQCKLLCMREHRCTGVVMTSYPANCSLRARSVNSYLKHSYYQDAYSKDLSRMYNFSTMPVFGESLDVVILYDIEWTEAVNPPTAVWAEWSPCMGVCGQQMRERACIGQSCRGSALQVCLNKTECCTYRKIAGLSPSILLPLYIKPSFDFAKCTQIDFNVVAKGCQGATVILNIQNGPGYELNNTSIEAFRTCVSHIGNHGVRSLGYIHTKSSIYNRATGIFHYTGFRNYDNTLKDARTWIHQWRNLPGFSGIFIDEVSSAYEASLGLWGKNHIQWYQSLINDIKDINPNLDIILNSGGICPIELLIASQAMPLPASTLVVYEGNNTHWSEHCQTFKAGPYCPLRKDYAVTTVRDRIEYNELQGSALLYGLTRDEAISGLEIARRDNLAYFYSSSVNLPGDPWDSVPTYFNDILKILNNY